MYCIKLYWAMYKYVQNLHEGLNGISKIIETIYILLQYWQWAEETRLPLKRSVKMILLVILKFRTAKVLLEQILIFFFTSFMQSKSRGDVLLIGKPKNKVT